MKDYSKWRLEGQCKIDVVRPLYWLTSFQESIWAFDFVLRVSKRAPMMLVRSLEDATEYLIIHSPHPFPSSCTIFDFREKNWLSMSKWLVITLNVTFHVWCSPYRLLSRDFSSCYCQAMCMKKCVWVKCYLIAWLIEDNSRITYHISQENVLV